MEWKRHISVDAHFESEDLVALRTILEQAELATRDLDGGLRSLSLSGNIQELFDDLMRMTNGERQYYGNTSSKT